MDIPWGWILIILGAIAILSNIGMIRLKKDWHTYLVYALALLVIAIGIGYLVIQPASLNLS